MGNDRRPISVAWYPVAIAAVIIPILWVALGYVEDGHAAMPAWAALLYHFGGRTAVVGVFAVAGYVWLCVALADRWPDLGTGLLLAGIGSAAVAIAGWAFGWVVVAAVLAWTAALAGALFLPGARVVFPTVWVAGGVAAGLAGQWCLASVPLLGLALWAWVAIGRRTLRARREAP